MSDKHASRPANASRRLFIASGSAGAVFAALGAAAVAQSRIAALIEDHRRAIAAFEVESAAYNAFRGRERESAECRRAEERQHEALQAMDAVFTALCAEPAGDLAGARLKAEYLLNFQEEYDQDDVAALLHSFLA